MNIRILLLPLSFACFALGAANQVPTKSPVHDLAERLLPGHGGDFVIETIPAAAGEDVFEVAPGADSKIVLRGNSPLSQAVALNYYLKNTAHVAVSWYVDAAVTAPAKLPPVAETVRKTTKLQNRFFLNYCTYGYTTPFWKWRDWERLIDWMALNSINMPLAQNGTEAIWQKVWRSYGLTDKEILDSWTGPAFLPWNRMANIDKWGGPLPQSYIDGQMVLQKKILARERGLGMKPILPAFAGHVPAALKRVKPDVQLTQLAPWPGMSPEHSTSFISPKDPLFREIQLKFLQEQEKEIGSDHLYGTDPFNEMNPPSWEPAYLASVSDAIYKSMAEADPEAKWVQMGWTFYNDRGHWSNDRIKAMIGAVPQGKMIMLDYVCEEAEMYPQTENYFGAPVVWCYLGNFGGNTHIVGPLNKVNRRLSAAMNNPKFTNLSGVGATLEGLNNQSVYECLFDRAWAGKEMDLQAWFKAQAQCHAGGPDKAVEEAWEILRTQVLVDNAQGINGHGVVFQSVPRLVTGAVRGWCNPAMPYDNANLLAAWAKMLQAGPAARAQDAYRFDLADVTRQALGNHGNLLREKMLDAYNKKDAVEFRKLSAQFLAMGRDLDAFLGTRSEFLLGKWVGDARDCAKDSVEADYYEQNARTVLSTWTGRDSSLTDYSSREWNGMLSSYYLVRWEIYLKTLADDLDKGEHNAAHQKALEEKMKDFEWAWARQAGGHFKATPEGDTYAMSLALYEKYVGKLP